MFPRPTSSGFSLVSHSQTPQTHVPRPEQSTTDVLSGLQPPTGSPVAPFMLSLSHSQVRPKCVLSHSQMPHLYVPNFEHCSAFLINHCKKHKHNVMRTMKYHYKNHYHTTNGKTNVQSISYNRIQLPLKGSQILLQITSLYGVQAP
jgi:hypothetical protein